MAQNAKSFTSSYHLANIFLIVFFLLLTLVGLSAIVIYKDIDGNVPPKGREVFLYMVKNYFSIPCRGFIVVGLLAGVMSTADSFLHTAGLLLVQRSYDREVVTMARLVSIGISAVRSVTIVDTLTPSCGYLLDA